MATRDTAQLILEVDARIATAQRAVNQLARSIQQDAAGMDGGLKKIEQSSERVARSLGGISGRTRSGFTQLSFQIGDVSQQLAMGTKTSTIFAQQSGQVIQALQIMGGEGNKFLQFLGGPWGLAIGTAAVVLAPLASKLFDTGDEVDKLVDKMREQAHQADLNRQADERWKQTIEGLTEAIRKRREEQEKSLQTDIEAEQASLRGAQDELADKIKQRDRLQKQINDFIAANRSQAGGPGALGHNIIEESDRKLQQMQRDLAQMNRDIATAEANVRGAQAPIAERNVADRLDKVKAATDAYTRALGNLRKQLQSGAIDQAKFEAELGKATAKRDADIKAAQAEGKAAAGGLAKVSLGEVQTLLNSNFDLFPESSHQLTGGKHAKNSYHYAGQAIDFVPRGGMDSINKDEIRKLVEAQGIKILELLGPGDPGHSDHFHLAFGKQRLGPDQIAKLQGERGRSADREASSAEDRSQAFAAESDRLDQQILAAKTQLLQGTDAQADAAIKSLQVEQTNYENAIDRQVADKKLNAADGEALKLKHSQLTFEKAKAVEIQRQLEHMRQSDENQQRSFQYQADDLRFADEMATTQAEHRKLQLEILDVVYQQKDAHLRALKAELELAGKIEEAAAVQAQLDRLPTEKAHDQARVVQGTMNPLEAWAHQVPKTAAEINEALQSIEARGLDNLSNALTEVVMGTKSLGEAFSDVARSIIADIIQMTIKMLIFRAISSIFGGGLGGGGLPGMSDGDMLGGNVFSFSSGLDGFANGGFIPIGGRGGVDNNILSINGMPRARVSADETLAVIPRTPRIATPRVANDQKQVVELRIATTEQFTASVQQIAGRVVVEAAPQIASAGAQSAVRSLTRPRLMGGVR